MVVVVVVTEAAVVGFLLPFRKAESQARRVLPTSSQKLLSVAQRWGGFV